MAKQVKSFRVSEESMERLGKIKKHHEELRGVLYSDLGIPRDGKMSNGELIEFLILQEYRKLEEQGYDLD
jgi:hypothetical protein